MNKIKFIAEKTNTGYSAYNVNANGIVATVGDDIADLKANILDGYNLQLAHVGKKAIAAEQIIIAFE